jgi:hypothetical protein
MYGTPAAAMTMSAFLVISAGFGVCEWTTVTVAFCLCKHIDKFQRQAITNPLPHPGLMIKESLYNLKYRIIKDIIKIKFHKKKHTWRSKAAGMPTTLLRPKTTACFPSISTPDLNSNSMQAFGVHETKRGARPCMANLPTFIGWKPSTSFSMLTAPTTFSTLICCIPGRVPSRSVSYTELKLPLDLHKI